MIKDKYHAFDQALKYSYQSVNVQKEGEEEPRKALINPDKNSTNYDDKILSIDYAYGFKPGDIFKWIGTDTYWIVYLPELTEDAYFRSQIRRCKYQISWLGEEVERGKRTKYTSYAYVRGPVETKINVTSKAGMIVNNPNWSLEIYLPATESAKKYFKRYQKFAFHNQIWEVQATDDISTDGILQIVALENYENSVLDDLEHQNVPDEEKTSDAFYIKPYIDPDTKDNKQEIIGETFIKPLGKFEYSLGEGIPIGGTWSVLEENYPVIIKNINESTVEVKWDYAKSGSFTLVYSNGDISYQRVIVVESLF